MSADNDLFSLAGNIILITGGAGLLGEQHARAIARFGGTPVILDPAIEKAEKLANDINDLWQVNAQSYCLDITNENDIEKTTQRIMQRNGKIDALINNAAINPKMEAWQSKNFSRLENFSLDQWQLEINVGLTGAFLCAKHFGLQIAKNPSGGNIINISSDLGVIAPDQRLYSSHEKTADQQDVKPVTYSVIKSGLIGLTRYLATYWPEAHVRANCLCPGGVENGQPIEFLTRVQERIPMNRMAKVDEYQGTLIWMLSNASSYLNGAIISVDGGRSTW